MPRSDAVRQVPTSDGRKALSLALELIIAAESAQAIGHWRVVGLSAVHAAISAADAALIAAAGLRSASQDHAGVVGLLEAKVPEFKMVQKRQVAGLLKEKSSIAYEQRVVTEVEARVMLDQAKRFVDWAGGVVEKRLG